MIVKTENLSREFVRGKNQFYAVDHVNLEVEEKELVAIMETDRRKDHSTGS